MQKTFCFILFAFALSAQPAGAERFMAKGNGVVIDFGKQLLWQQVAASRPMTWQEAQDYCQDLALGGIETWSLPTLLQLKSLEEPEKKNHIDSGYFRGTRPLPYWSATEDEKFRNSVWTFDFGSGHAGLAKKSSRLFVRCVR